MSYKKCVQSVSALLISGILIASGNSYAQSRIIKGSPASVTDFPWMASLFVLSDEQSGVGGACGGTLIHPEWVLTAAHCFLNASSTEVDLSNVAQTEVTLNSNSLDPLDAGALVVNGISAIVHPDYRPDPNTSGNVNDNDMALLKLATPVTTITPVTLIEGSTTDIEADTITTVMGWGATGVNNQGQSIDASNTLLKVDQKVVANAECSQIYQEGITDNMLCAGGLDAMDTSDSCQGDSGGPIVVQNGSSYTQVGVVSFGGVESACAEKGVPGVYAKIARYKSFIEQHVSGVSFVALGGEGGNGGTNACTGATLDNSLNVVIPCLVYEDTAYATQLNLSDDSSYTWAWSGELTPSGCTIDAAACTTISSNFDLTLRKLNIEGTDYTVILQYDAQLSADGTLFWNYLSHE